MKKLLLFCALSAIAFAGMAQIVKGSKVIGGGLTYLKSTGDYENQTNSSFEIIPAIGYFVADGFAVGLTVGYLAGKSEVFNSTTKSSGFQAGPFARYYKQTSNENFAIYGQFSFLLGSGKQTNSGNVGTKNSSLLIAVSPGLAYFLNEHWAVELGFHGIRYSATDPNKDVDDNSVNDIEIGLNSLVPATLGFRYHF